MLFGENFMKLLRRSLSFNVTDLIKTFDFPAFKVKTAPVTGLFDIAELNEPNGLTNLAENVESIAGDLISHIYSCDENPLPLFDQLSDSICQVADLAEFLRHCGPFHAIAQSCFVRLSSLVEKLNTDKNLFDKIKKYEFKSERDAYVSRLYAIDFEQCGIHLAEDNRQRFCHIQNDLVAICSQFQEGCYKPVKVASDSWKIHSQNKVITWNSFHYLSNEKERQFHYEKFFGPNEIQEKTFWQMISKRHELANVCGFSSYSDRVLRTSMISEPRLVVKILNDLSAQIKPYLEHEYKLLNAFKGSSVKPWDFPYLTMKFMQNTSRFHAAESASYFSLGTCIEGINMIVRRLFNINIRIMETKPGEIWDNDVEKLGVFDCESEKLLGLIYCDFFERQLRNSSDDVDKAFKALKLNPGKANIDCHFTVRCTRTLSDGSRQVPLIVLHLNFPARHRNQPVLLSPAMMENLFHEFGHAFHSVLSMTYYQHVAGTRCAVDFAEMPSQLFEYYAKDIRVLSAFARHWKTGQPIPQDLLSSFCCARKYFIACDLQNQIYYSLLDQRLHSSKPFMSANEIADLYQEQTLMKYIDKTYPYLRFAHFVEYGSKYYSYIVSKAIASIFWHTQLKSDPFSSAIGEKLKREVLSRGGECSPHVLTKNFTGKALAVHDLVEGILSEIQELSLNFSK